MYKRLPLPPHYDRSKADQLYRVPYQSLADAARNWARHHAMKPASADDSKIAFIAVDIQNAFCLPDFELFVGGHSGMGAVEDTQRLTEFIYTNLGRLNRIFCSMDTHQAMQIFHGLFFTDANGNAPPPHTVITAQSVKEGRWRVRDDVARSLGYTPEYTQSHLNHYVQTLSESDKYELTVWPYHALLGGVSHALVPLFEEAVFFHTVARYSQPEMLIKGSHPLTEHYSILGPEVDTDAQGNILVNDGRQWVERLKNFDAILIAGQAKSHCMAWTIDDMLSAMQAIAPEMVSRVYILEDCTTPVVIPGVVDYTEAAEAAFSRFKAAGMHMVSTAVPISDWPDFPVDL